MNSPTRFLAPLLLVWTVCVSPLQGQEGGVSATYRITSFGTGALKSASYANSPDGEPVRVTKMHVSNPVKARLRDEVFLDFYAEEAVSGEPPAFSLRVPSSNRNDLLVILMTTGEEVKPVLIDLKAIKLQGGGQYVYNLLPVAVAVQCGEKSKPVSIKPGGRASVPAPSADKVIQTLYYADPKQGKPVKFSSSIYFKDEETRQVVFCYAEEGARLPKVAPICIYKQRKPAEQP